MGQRIAVDGIVVVVVVTVGGGDNVGCDGAVVATAAAVLSNHAVWTRWADDQKSITTLLGILPPSLGEAKNGVREFVM